MRLAIGIETEILATPRPTGVERALRLWLTHLPDVPGITVTAFHRTPNLDLPPKVRSAAAPSLLPLALWRETHLPRLIKESAVDLLLSPVAAIPLRSPVPVIATIHELPWLNKGCGPADPREFSRTLLAFRAAQTILTVSAATARQCLKFAKKRGISHKKIRVARHGFNPLPWSDPILPTVNRLPLAITIAAPRRRKNLPAHLELFAQVAKEIPDAKYVLVGPQGRRAERLLAKARSLGVGHQVSLPGFLPDCEIAALLARAALLLHLPLSEGFGFTPLEALNLGCLPFLSPIGALPEICGKAALYQKPGLLKKALLDPKIRQETLAHATPILLKRDPKRAAERLVQICAETVTES